MLDFGARYYERSQAHTGVQGVVQVSPVPTAAPAGQGFSPSPLTASASAFPGML